MRRRRAEAHRLRTRARCLAAVVVLVAGAVQAGEPAPRLLILGVDAMPFELARDLARGERAIFKGMRGPAAVINAFPTNSYVTWTGLLEPLGYGRTAGYESRYFDWQRREVVEGYDLKDPEAPWKDFFDWRLEGVITTAIAYGWPKRYSLKEVDEAFAAFERSDAEIFAAYIISTDALGHLHGPEALATFLRALDRKLTRLRARTRARPFHTVLVSDHGMAGGEALVNAWPAIERSVEQAGFSIRDRVADARDAAFIPFGLLSSFIAYSEPGAAAALARAIVAAEGVDLCVMREGDGWEIQARRGEARVERRESQDAAEWRYHARRGDPLIYAPVLAKLRAAARSPKESWFADRRWFEASRDAFYPDALYRLAGAFAHVRNPASIVCSISPGYMFGGLLTEYVAIPTVGRLRWTHGALHRAASLGFLMTDVPGWNPPAAVRYDEALKPLAARLRRAKLSARSANP